MLVDAWKWLRRGLAAGVYILYYPLIATAQTGPVDPVPPPSVTTVSPGGVDFASGSYSSDFADLTIGGEGSAGLKFVRSYNSALAREHSSIIGINAQGWSYNWAMRISISAVPPPPGGLSNPSCPGGLNPETFCGEQVNEFFHSVVLSNRSIKFQNQNLNSMTGNNVGTYNAVDDYGLGTSLVFSGNHNDGFFTFIDKYGTIYKFHSISSEKYSQIDNIIYPDGTIVQFHYSGPRINMIESSRGMAFALNYGPIADGTTSLTKVCAINLAVQFYSIGSECPASAPYVSYAYAQSPIVYHNGSYMTNVLTSSTNTFSQTTNFTYDDGGHVNCIKDPGSLVCKISLTYSTCQQDPDYAGGVPGARYPGLHLMERVVEQQFVTGDVITYSSPASHICPTPGGTGDSSDGNGTYWFQEGAGSRTYVDILYGKPTSQTDPLGRVLALGHRSPSDIRIGTAGLLFSATKPGGQVVDLQYDGRGNRTESRQKSNLNQSDQIINLSSFPASCSSALTCNSPISVTDPSGSVTSFTYSSAHGGVLTETGPSVDGISPVRRFGYVQRYVWLSNSNGGYSRAVTPVWLLSEERTCRATATIGNSCSGGLVDEVVTTYDYGPDNGAIGNNLFVRGTSVTAEGITRRTCYGYDALGSRIWEASPRAGLTTCS